MYQDWEKKTEEERTAFIPTLISAYRATAEFRHALDAGEYYAGSNPTVMRRKKMSINGSAIVDGKSVPMNCEVESAKIPSSFFGRLVTQLNQYLLINGVQLKDKAQKDALGTGFDSALLEMGELSLVHGVSYAFYNVDHVEVIASSDGPDSGFVPLLDERTSEIRVGVQFWRIASDRPMYARLFEEDGVTLYRIGTGGEVTLDEAKRAYKVTISRDGLGVSAVYGENYGVLPIVPLYANRRKKSELTESLRRKIDAYDVILSDYSDNLDRTNEVYWVINNFGGTRDQVIGMLAEINRLKATYTQNDGIGGAQSTAEPHTIDVPYAARQVALDIIKKEIYEDFMALNLNDLTGGSLTNVAIRAAEANLDMHANAFEACVFKFVQRMLALVGVKTEDIRFERQTIANKSETVTDIYQMRQDISRRKALELNPYIEQDEIDKILQDAEAESVSGLPDAAALDKAAGGDGA